MKRVFLMVLDSVGIGEMPDAAQYGDAGSNTLAAASTSSYFSMPNMQKLGLFNIDGVECRPAVGKGYHHWSLGNRGNRIPQAAANLSGWISKGAAGCI